MHASKHAAGVRVIPGRLIVAGMILLAVSLAAFALWFQWRQTRRCLAFYGADAARCIQHADRVELWQPVVTAEGTGRLQPAARADISGARGLVHLRRGLVEDGNFLWDATAGGDGSWDAALAFYEEGTASEPAAVLAIDFGPDAGSGAIEVVGRPGRVGLGRLAKGLRSWLESSRAEAGR